MDGPSTIAAALLTVLAGCGTHDAVEQRDVLLVTIDTLRPDVLGTYGHPRPTSPHLDALADQGAVFERAYTTSPMTGPAHASMLTGLQPSEHGLVRNGYVLDDSVPHLAEVLAEDGYRTLGVVGGRVLEAKFAYARGFEEYDSDFGDPKRNTRPAEEVVQIALDMLAEDDGRPTFLWVHVYDPHDPYDSPPPSDDWRAASAEVLRERVEPSDKFTADFLTELFVDYEQEVVRTDAALAPLFEAWDARRSGREGVLTVLSDHGEGLGEHRFLGHGTVLWEEQIRIPWILRAPEIEAGRRVDGQVSITGLARTLLELAAPHLSEELPGASLVPALMGTGSPSADVRAERPVYALRETGRKRAGPGRAVDRERRAARVDGRWKYVWREDSAPLLFDLRTDPAEAVDLASTAEEQLRALAALEDRWRRELVSVGASLRLDDVETEAMLEALGYQ